MNRYNFALSLFVLLGVAQVVSAATTTLSFNAPVGGTINDTNGFGTGFTHRLPGTGSAIAANDPNMDLQTSPGKLRLTSTQADLNQFPGPTGTNLANLRTPGLFLPGIGTQDFTVKALFEDVTVPNASDQLQIYVGVDENKNIRAGIHETNVYVFTQNQGSGDINAFTGPASFSTGDDIELTVSRLSGSWSLSWSNLTAATTGSLPSAVLPWLNSENDLYVGVLAANPGTNTSFVGIIDYFSVTVVPEPSGAYLAGIAGISFLRMRRRSRG